MFYMTNMHRHVHKTTNIHAGRWKSGALLIIHVCVLGVTPQYALVSTQKLNVSVSDVAKS